MKSNLLALLIIVCVSTNSYPQEHIEQPYCMSGIDYKGSANDLKKELLSHAKRMAVNRFFGQIINSYSIVDQGTLSKDKIVEQSFGILRVLENPDYYNGDNWSGWRRRLFQHEKKVFGKDISMNLTRMNVIEK